ncbi:hypothetical protein LQG66_19490 [Bradyrhizobium ontarionense]|uniref:Uncharacterized protein n=1 Tax=Bradyrhizobium ontarionense TaxID=2898149 RepID=A0ABY3RLN2_9BRAD|nr:hypothetical protein [Bradyrhizobium sp. A19]UFZ08410.1 hypothetical protein LQG66_19490 [Bradyrhizobium sp. A19]
MVGVTSVIGADVDRAAAQPETPPPIAEFGALPDAMIFYVAHGPSDSCGPGCADWIAAEGTIQFDTFKRLIAILDRQSGRKLPVVINSRGEANLNVAVSMGRILRDRGFDTSVGRTLVEACRGKQDGECLALKRSGGALEAKLDASRTVCETSCLLMLAGGAHRSLPPDTKVELVGMEIRNRLAPNVSAEHRSGLTTYYGEQVRLYLREMGVDAGLIDIVDRNWADRRRPTEVPPAAWLKLGLVTSGAL